MNSPTKRPANAAIRFEPEDFQLSSSKIMGRHSAGSGFLRAAIAGRDGQPLSAYTARRASALVFRDLVAQYAPEAETQWLPAGQLDLLAQAGTLYQPDPDLGGAARLRLRAGTAAYSLVGVTHTTASHGAMSALTGLLTAPVMPWDAVICTSNAVLASVKVLLEKELEYLRWRFGAELKVDLPQFPVIPLGVHCQDFDFTPAQRADARQALGIAGDEVVLLFVGRLSFHAKAHPHVMFKALQAAAERSGKKLVLLQCGWFANEPIERAFTEGAARYCPAVRSLVADGADAAQRDRCWAAGDVFMSLSDNLQETFGLTPVEAMAAGLPVLVTDWNGYKDTVRDNVDGYRIPTWMPPAGLGAALATSFEAGNDTYDFYCGLTCQTVSVDMQVLVERLTALAGDPALRASLGQAGRRRARTLFDWGVVYRQYQGLWGELGALRISTAADPRNAAFLQAAPRAAADRCDPFQMFAHYPTRQIAPDTVVSLAPGASAEAFRGLAQDMLFNYARKIMPSEALAGHLFALLATGPFSVAQLGAACETDAAAPFDTAYKAGAGELVLILAILAKMNLLVFSPAPGQKASLP